MPTSKLKTTTCTIRLPCIQPVILVDNHYIGTYIIEFVDTSDLVIKGKKKEETIGFAIIETNSLWPTVDSIIGKDIDFWSILVHFGPICSILVLLVHCSHLLAHQLKVVILSAAVVVVVVGEKSSAAKSRVGRDALSRLQPVWAGQTGYTHSSLCQQDRTTTHSLQPKLALTSQAGSSVDCQQQRDNSDPLIPYRSDLCADTPL